MPPTVYDGLRAYYKFEDALNPGLDTSGFTNDAVATDVDIVSGGLFGTGLRPLLSTGKLAAPFSVDFRLMTRVSISVWINLDKALDVMWGEPTFIDQRGGASRGYFLGVLPAGGKTVSFRVHNAAGTPYTASYVENATSGWVHIVGVYEGAVVRIYRNGVSQATAVADGTMLIGMDPLDSIGLGFEGIIDELQLWGRALSGAEVTSLYNGGAGLEIVTPNLARGADHDVDLPYLLDPYDKIDADMAAVPTPYVAESFTMTGSAYSTDGTFLPSIDAPYTLRDSPKRIFIDPQPAIVSVTVDGSHLIHATAEAGPTDADELVTWWEIELLPGQVFIVAERHTESEYSVRRQQNDDWQIPLGQDWRGLSIRFVMQSVADASQMWASAPTTLTGFDFDNAPVDVPTYDDPLPALISVSIDDQFNVTATGEVGPTDSTNVQTWWEVDVDGTGEFLCVAAPRYPVMVQAARQTVVDQFTVPVGISLAGKNIRFAARAEFDSKQVWYSAPLLLGGDFDNGSFKVSPLPPGPPAAPPLRDIQDQGGVGIQRRRNFDFSGRRT